MKFDVRPRDLKFEAFYKNLPELFFVWRILYKIGAFLVSHVLTCFSAQKCKKRHRYKKALFLQRIHQTKNRLGNFLEGASSFHLQGCTLNLMRSSKNYTGFNLGVFWPECRYLKRFHQVCYINVADIKNIQI